MKKKQYVSPSVLRAAPFAPRASLLGGSVNFGVSTSTQDQVVSSYDASPSPSSTFNHEWE